MAIWLHNTLSRQKEEFIPRKPGHVSMYVCGPTTYNFIHLGNARMVVFFDTVRRYFLYRGYKVHYIQNFTDIDDRIINQAQKTGEEPLELARRFMGEYFRDAEALNVLRADVHPQVSTHLPEIISLIGTLLERGKAYQADGDVLFPVRSFPGYGKLSGRSMDEMMAGARVEVDLKKRDPLDFVLWKAAKPGEPSWESPWGKGRPGWHIECSAMALKYMGPGFDIHGGGNDLIFPHHENEIAQSEAAVEKPFARYWMHNGFVTVDQEKMSKSTGNFFLVRDILSRFPGEMIRFFLLSTHYRSPIDFDEKVIEACGKGLLRLKNSIGLLCEALDSPCDEEVRPAEDNLAQYKNAFESAMDDDFNTAMAISAMFDLARAVNSFLHDHCGCRFNSAEMNFLQGARELFEDMNGVLGVLPVDPQTGRISVQCLKLESGQSEKLLNLLIDVREKARVRKDWETADHIRTVLKEMGIVLEDTPGGVRWKRQEQQGG